MRILPLWVHTRLDRAVAVVLIGVAGTAVQTSAQSMSEQTLYRTRQYLDSTAGALERAGKKEESAAIRERLRVGDFYPGERLVVDMFGGEEPFRDTVSVRAGQEIVISTFPAFSLKGVLRSEADSAVTAQAKKYIQRPIVRTTPLVRMLVTGAVGRPGWITVRGDAAVTDVVTAAGGLTSQARVPKSKVKRGPDLLVGKDSLGIVFRSGMTLDQADLRSGDELVIDEKKPSNFTNMIFSVSILMGAVISIISLTSR